MQEIYGIDIKTSNKIEREESIMENKTKKLMFNLFNEYDDCDEITNALRSLESEKEISEAEYDYILINWDRFLNEYEQMEGDE